jgi:hypothetical protein
VSKINRVDRLIINLDTAMPLSCAWDDCTKRARTPYQIRAHEHTGACNSFEAQFGRHMIYAFCSESHRDYWMNATGIHAHMSASMNRGRIYGMHTPGNRLMNR